ncbi:unnamed protein product [Soboliphyme baturini]|uniref:leucine--tRNA ligase n=1 Tax=Soboliphyme baturini TaxID=241478 RepID=A0A3P8BLR3_9BILA|nr:unnamed protein product [Soboliphyme baturini]
MRFLCAWQLQLHVGPKLGGENGRVGDCVEVSMKISLVPLMVLLSSKIISSQSSPGLPRAAQDVGGLNQAAKSQLSQPAHVLLASGSVAAPQRLSKIDERTNQQQSRTRSEQKNHDSAAPLYHELYEDLNDVSNWADIVNIQRHWIGECNAYRVTLKLYCQEISDYDEQIDLCLGSPSELINGRCVVVKSTHVLNQSKYWNNVGGQSCLKVKCENPVTGELMDVVVTDDYPYDEFTDAHLGLTDVKSSKCIFEDRAEDAKVKIISDEVCSTFDEGQAEFIFQIDEQSQNVLQLLTEKGYHIYPSSHKLRDWVVSRQRYWGTPIPIIHCPNCKTVPVSKQCLPIILPDANGRNHIECGPVYNLAAFPDWVNVRCPVCNSHAKRETDTLDTFFDSSWYFLRYLDAHNRERPFDPSKVEEYMPVDVYVGGKEHATLHLYYARFMNHFLHRLGWVRQKEPFARFLAQGMVMNKAYQIAETAQYIPEERVKKDGAVLREESGKIVTFKWEKMSKSKHNGVNPLAILDEYGRDFTRLLVMANVSPQSFRNWNLDNYKGLQHWINRITWLINMYLKEHSLAVTDRRTLASDSAVDSVSDASLRKKYNFTVRKVSFHLESTHLLNTAISCLQKFTNDLRKCPTETIKQSSEFTRCLRSLIVMLFPFAPHVSAEFWGALSNIPACKNFFPVLQAYP